MRRFIKITLVIAIALQLVVLSGCHSWRFKTDTTVEVPPRTPVVDGNILKDWYDSTEMTRAADVVAVRGG